jgi:hypothetical protein
MPSAVESCDLTWGLMLGIILAFVLYGFLVVVILMVRHRTCQAKRIILAECRSFISIHGEATVDVEAEIEIELTPNNDEGLITDDEDNKGERSVTFE